MRNVYAAKHNLNIVICSAMQEMRLCDKQVEWIRFEILLTV